MSKHTWTVFRVLAVVALLGWRASPDEWNRGTIDRLRWAMGCDEIENLDRLLSHADCEQVDQQGYYNQLLDARLSPPIGAPVFELRQIVLRPSLSIVRHDGTTWTTNALGMRDRPYSVKRQPGTFRIAMTGDSIGVALGVSDGRGFEPILERRLDERSRRGGGPSVEVLNLSLPGRSPGQRWDHFRKTGWQMEPDLVLFEATNADVGWDRRRLSELLPHGIGLDSPLYGDVLDRAGIKPGKTIEEYGKALNPFRWELLAAVYRSVVADCRARGVPCVYILIPRVGRPVDPAQHHRLVTLAKASGFDAVVDVSDTFDGRDPATLAIHPSDFHPNAEGHAMLAQRLIDALWPIAPFEPMRTALKPDPDDGKMAAGGSSR